MVLVLYAPIVVPLEMLSCCRLLFARRLHLLRKIKLGKSTSSDTSQLLVVAELTEHFFKFD